MSLKELYLLLPPKDAGSKIKDNIGLSDVRYRLVLQQRERWRFCPSYSQVFY